VPGPSLVTDDIDPGSVGDSSHHFSVVHDDVFEPSEQSSIPRAVAGGADFDRLNGIIPSLALVTLVVGVFGPFGRRNRVAGPRRIDCD